MKLRIKGNSIRIRLMQSEVQKLQQAGVYKEEVYFPGGEVLGYLIDVGDAYYAEFTNNQLNVTIPRVEANEWFDSEALSLMATLENGLGLLIEKDLECMMPRKGEDESDAYPNPKKSH